MAEEVHITKGDRIKVWWRSTFLQGSWNYERMQNGGWAYTLIPALKRLYHTKEDRSAALKRHLEFFTPTHIWLHRFWVLRWHWKKNVLMVPQLTIKPFRVSKSG